MALELIMIVVTGVLSGLDVVVNIFGLCMSGHCRSSCCGASFSHHENDYSSSESGSESGT